MRARCMIEHVTEAALFGILIVAILAFLSASVREANERLTHSAPERREKLRHRPSEEGRASQEKD
jgi:cell division protein FtsN